MLSNLKELVSNMKKNDWVIDLFNFEFNGIRYFVFVQLYSEDERKPQYSLAKLLFIDSNDNDRKFLIHSNSKVFLELNVRAFREFFHIPYVENHVGDAIVNFQERLGNVIPILVTKKTNQEIVQIVNHIDSNQQRNRGTYLSHVIRLPQGNHRRCLTDNKAKLLRPDVYNHFADDKTISFCFFEDENRENDLIRILELFERGNH
ncbi:hypothetical protein A4G19_06470 [Pasteurellaceae bacterium Macca]|nr:hypothetical protein [Pasteurellaceae bacterium Macca]